MYLVEKKHHCKGWRNGDLEDQLEILGTKHFNTKKAAKAYIESEIGNKPKKEVARYPHTGDTPSNYYWFTGETWIHENTGQEMQEYYQYTLKKLNR